jgi:hypothetical protein
MTDWRTQTQEYSNRENLAALRKEYARGLETGDFPDTEESWKAFVRGWQGTRIFQNAKRDLNNTGSDSYTLMSVSWLAGFMLLSMAAMLYFILPSPALELPNFWGLPVIGSILIGFGFLMLRRSHRLFREAAIAHREKWGDPATVISKTVDE